MNKEKYKTGLIEKILKDSDIPEIFHKYIIGLALKSETPIDLENKLSDLSNKLDISLEDYRDNWHSINCECDECIEEERKDYGAMNALQEEYEEFLKWKKRKKK